jgi:hypothetical protein
MQMSPARNATLVVSVDLRHGSENSSVVTGLLDSLRRRGAPALWSLEFARVPAVVDRILGARAAHEFGVLGTGDWAGSRASRTTFARELAARLARAADAGVSPVALALHDVDPPRCLDLLVKRQVPMLRLRMDESGGTASSLQPRLARFGIWQSKPTIVVPVHARWSLPWTARRLLQRAVDRNQALHVAVDGESLARNPSAGLATLDYVLKLASARRDGGQLQFAPLSQLIRMYSPQRTRIASRSVLRAA